MNAQVNGSVLDPRDVNVPSKEPMASALSQPRAVETPDSDVIDDNRRDQINASAPALAPYHAEKYTWKFSAGGKPYLSPLETYLTYVAGRKAKPGVAGTHGAASRVADFALGMIYPGGERGKTEEAALVERLKVSAKEFLLDARASSELEGKAFERHLIDRVTRNASYAASTQFELENWAERAAAAGRDASEHQSFGEKESRMLRFALEAGKWYAVVREILPDAKLDADAFDRAATGIVYETAESEGRKLLSPLQLNERQKAGADAAKISVRRF